MPKKMDRQQSPYEKRKVSPTGPAGFNPRQNNLGDILELLFVPSGRVSRGTYWIWLAVTIVLRFLIKKLSLSVTTIIFGPQLSVTLNNVANAKTQTASLHINKNSTEALVVISVIFFLPLIWMGLVMFVKRIHDINGRPWIRVLLLFTIVGWLWVLYELYIKEGDQGTNDYGTEPRF